LRRFGRHPSRRQRAGADSRGEVLRLLADRRAVIQLDHGQLALAALRLQGVALSAPRWMLDELVLDPGLVERLLDSPAGVRPSDPHDGAAVQLDGHLASFGSNRRAGRYTPSWTAHGRSAGDRARARAAAGGGRAAHEPLVRSRRPARERHGVARRGGLRRRGVGRAQRGAASARDRTRRPPRDGGGAGRAQPGAQPRAGAEAAGGATRRRARDAPPTPADPPDGGVESAPDGGEAPAGGAQGAAPAARVAVTTPAVTA